MDLNELQSVRDRERQTDKLQQLRGSFYADAGAFIQQLRAERERAVERADDPFDSPEVQQLTDEINTAQQTVEATYEKRVGKVVKAASFAAADLPTEADGMTTEEQALFDQLVSDIKTNREHVLTLLDGNEPSGSRKDSDGLTEGSSTESETREATDSETHTPPHPDSDASEHSPRQHVPPDVPPSEASADDSSPAVRTDETRHKTRNEDAGGVAAADVMGGARDEQTTPPVRKDGGTDTISQESAASLDAQSQEQVERQRVQVVEDVDTFVGFDDRDYDLDADDIVSLPETNADVLLERGVARKL